MAHILIVDQDDIAADLAAGILTAAGHNCATATDGDQAWRMLQWRLPDVLLLDEGMGRTFHHRLRGSPAFRDLPVLLLTTAPDGIGKPLQPALLLDRVARQLQARAPQWAEFQLHHGKDDGPSKVYL